jgi:hypothetical protein
MDEQLEKMLKEFEGEISNKEFNFLFQFLQVIKNFN